MVNTTCAPRTLLPTLLSVAFGVPQGIIPKKPTWTRKRNTGERGCHWVGSERDDEGGNANPSAEREVRRIRNSVRSMICLGETYSTARGQKKMNGLTIHRLSFEAKIKETTL